MELPLFGTQEVGGASGRSGRDTLPAWMGLTLLPAQSSLRTETELTTWKELSNKFRWSIGTSLGLSYGKQNKWITELSSLLTNVVMANQKKKREGL